MRTILLPLLAVLVLACAPAEPSASPAASGPPEASPTSAPTGGIAMPADLRYRCDDGAPFSLDILDDPADAELEQHPSAQALRDAIAQPQPEFEWMPAAGYWLVYRDDERADYVAHLPAGDPPFADVTLRFRDGQWGVDGWGGCRPVIALDGLSPAAWILDPDAPVPDAATTDLALLVNELACTGGEPMGARLLAPRVIERDDVVLIVFGAVPLEGDAFTCPGNPPMRVVVRLSAPLGDRILRDASGFPPKDPTAPES